MGDVQGSGEPPAQGEAERTGRGSLRLVTTLLPGSLGSSQTLTTVLVALGCNVLIAAAKSAAAAVTGSASMAAETVHAWADCGNSVFLLAADRRSHRPADEQHPIGYGREAYVWSLLAALGVFVLGGAVSVIYGAEELIHRSASGYFTVGYAVLAVSLVFDAISFRQSARQARSEAQLVQRDVLEHVMATSDPTLRAVFSEDSAAMIGDLIAAAGLAATQLTGSAIPDATGSILIGVLLAVVAVLLIDRNRQFLIGQEADPRARAAALQTLLAAPEVDRVTYLRLEYAGPRTVLLISAVDLTGDDPESRVATRLRALEARIRASPAVAGAVLSLSAPDEPALRAPSTGS